MLSGMRWIFCSLTQLLVSICSSTDVSEAGFTPEDKMKNCQQELPGMKKIVVPQKTYISSAAPWSCPAIQHAHNQTKSGSSNSEHKTGTLISGGTAGFTRGPVTSLSNVSNVWASVALSAGRTQETINIVDSEVPLPRSSSSTVSTCQAFIICLHDRIQSQRIPTAQTTPFQKQSHAVLHIATSRWRRYTRHRRCVAYDQNTERFQSNSDYIGRYQVFQWTDEEVELPQWATLN